MAIEGSPLPTEESAGKSLQTPTPTVVPFVHFQQTLIRERVKTMSADEKAAVTQYIEQQHAAAVKAWERPWLAKPKDSKLPEELVTSSSPGTSEEDLEMSYYLQYVV